MTIPRTVNDIGECAFCKCPELIEIKVDPKNDDFVSVDGVLFKKQDDESSGSLLVQFPAGKGVAYTIPSNITRIFANAFSGCDKLESVIIPSNVTKIENSAFRNCHNLTNVTYEGSSDVGINSKNIFDACESLSFICVPENYNGTSFCSVGELARGAEKCDELHAMENQCFRVVIEGKENVTVKERDNATLWEQNTKGCVKYYCDNETGGEIEYCNSNQVCMDDACISIDILKDSSYVELDYSNIGVGISITDIDINVIIESLNDLCDFNITDIAVETNDDGHVIRIFVIVSDENQGNRLKEKIQDDCDLEPGILCHPGNVHTHSPERVLSISVGISHYKRPSFITLILTLFFIIIHF